VGAHGELSFVAIHADKLRFVYSCHFRICLTCCEYPDECVVSLRAQCEAASDIAVFDKERVLWLTTRYRAFEMLTGEDVHDLFDPDGKGHAVPGAAKRAYFW
jgi:hypothetical protein